MIWSDWVFLLPRLFFIDASQANIVKYETTFGEDTRTEDDPGISLT